MSNLKQSQEIPEMDIDNIRGAVRSLLDAGIMTAAQLAREAELTSSRLSQFLGGTYKGSNTKIAQSLTVWLETYHNRQNALPAVPDFVETPTVKQIWGALQYAQLTRTITVVHGNPGVSKTTALEQFEEGRPNVWMITVSRSRGNVLECLYEAALAVGIAEPVCRRATLARQLRQRLTDTGGLLIIDEADFLDYDTLEELRILQGQARIGLALIGNHNVYNRMTGNNRRSVDFARLFARIARRVTIDRPRKADVDAIADAWALANAEREQIDVLVRQPGALHSVFAVLTQASTLAQARKESLNHNHIRAVMRNLGYAQPREAV